MDAADADFEPCGALLLPGLQGWPINGSNRRYDQVSNVEAYTAVIQTGDRTETAIYLRFDTTSAAGGTSDSQGFVLSVAQVADAMVCLEAAAKAAIALGRRPNL